MFEPFILIYSALKWTAFLILIIIVLIGLNKLSEWKHQIGLYIDRKLNQDLYTLLVSGVLYFIIIWGFWIFIDGIVDFDNRVPIGQYSSWLIGTMLPWGILVIVAATVADITNTITKRYDNEAEE